ncbi:hypothetical protein MSAN_01924800 [Mycena sanguinolenta]|uniref:DUF6534 domain-containing protein n=1 Tax=Mycena sanguinolenta TaxID=230812 RepID=A0A8H6XQ49_9AGAR|nr:hypothetical protein MSAN_01924800 [Mycena sanguinolenta]
MDEVPSTSVGPLLLGILLNTYLYGLVTNQYVNYVKHKFNDPAWIKAIVIVLFAVDTAHTIVGVYAAWDMCVANFNNPDYLSRVNWSIPFTAVAAGTSGAVTQIFLIHRVFKLTNNKCVVVVLVTLSAGSLVSGWMAGIRAGIIGEVRKFNLINPLVTCWLTLLAAVDLLITAILSFVLSRSKTGFRRTDTIINRLIRGAIQTGLFAFVFALSDLISFRFAPNTTFYGLFAFPIGRIYTNTLLDTLNARMVFYRMDQQSSSGRWQTGVATNAFHIQTCMHQTFVNVPPDTLVAESAEEVVEGDEK